ncbi:hypothetical protein LXM50_01630 [Microbacterium sp. Au-Mic1]|uniref:LpqB family beta-propeller domain-containing protein n=1 Tax=Microbacterium sp. Au-Mic1 TaxID=2906457 RepID=UPI001E2E40BD|nr:hypothetical protein [Microbacterium sp. Au-Mic1]MCE4024667.1 hypothetical protein [Microbacterium sp. Au-Mic1]
MPGDLATAEMYLSVAKSQCLAYAPPLPVNPVNGTIVLGPPTVMSRNLFPDPSIGTAGNTVVLRQNVIRNPSFETDASLWTVTNSATISRVTTQAHRGTASLQVVTAGATSGEGVYSSTYTVPGMYLNRPYAASVWVFAPVGANMEALGNSTGGPSTSVPFTGTGAWQLVTMPNNRANSGLNPYIIVRTRSTAQAITFYVDEALLELDVATPGPYFDGAGQSAPDADFSTRWVGAANASISELTAVLVPGVVASNCVPIRSGIWATDGNMSMRTIPTGANPTVTVANIPGANTLLATRRDPGDVISEVRENINGPAVLYPSATQNTWFDQIGIFAGDYAGLWFSGDTPTRLGRTYAWEGAVNASASAETYRPNVFVPAPPEIPENYFLAIITQARNMANAGVAPVSGGDFDGSGYGVNTYPLDWAVKQMLRPEQGLGAIA